MILGLLLIVGGILLIAFTTVNWAGWLLIGLGILSILLVVIILIIAADAIAQDHKHSRYRGF